ncbi:MAG: glycoside hydrolase family 108 protein [Rhodospirillaceae bacterium]|nr:glycoside hydrolase family 108 protein [Rhodospirillales bacterium]
MADIDSMLNDIISREGGYVNNAADRGGPTNMGITQATLSNWLGHPATVADVQTLSVETAKAIYSANYYSKPKIDQLPDLIQAVMLDAAVNSGPGQSVKWLQQVLNTNNYGPLTVDGGIGPATIGAATKAATDLGPALSRALIEIRRAFLNQLCQENPSQQQFEKGWMARCDGLEATYCPQVG